MKDEWKRKKKFSADYLYRVQAEWIHRNVHTQEYSRLDVNNDDDAWEEEIKRKKKS